MVAQGTTTSSTSTTFATAPSSIYYWRVRARDDYEPTTWSLYGNSPPGRWVFSTLSPQNTPPTITIVSPAGGELWRQGEHRSVMWMASDNEDPSSSLVVFINYTSSAGDGHVCGPVWGDVGSCAWTLPAIGATDVIVNATVVDTGGLKGYDEGGPLTIRAPPHVNTPPVVTILSPVAGEVFERGSSHDVTWSMQDAEDEDWSLTVYLNYSTGGTTATIVAGTTGMERFLWILPGILAADVVVNITVIDTGGLRGWDESGPFEIRAPTSPPIISAKANFKPLVALAFAVILAAVGYRSSRKRPWNGGKDRMAVAKAFAIMTMPFVFAETMTGIVSLLTGQLSIPPAVGIGTALDLAILIVGVMAPLIRLAKDRNEV